MTIDYDSHPADIKNVEGGIAGEKAVGIRDLKQAIPAHCFQPSAIKSFWYLFRDLAVASTFGYLAFEFIPLIESWYVRAAAWAFYGWVQGLVFTGLWVIGHECGHACFSTSHFINSAVGWILHSFLLTPYFSWRSSHRRHHIYANHMELDHNFVPPRKEAYLKTLGHKLDEISEDSPLYILARIIMQQLLGFPAYLLANITASRKSLANKPSEFPLNNSHFAPWGALFRKEEAHLILLSDIGVGVMMAALYHLGGIYSSSMIMLLYLQPYLWVNHWIVAITYLHHTHPELPKYGAESWTFIRGATATVDREFGFIGRHFFHNIIEYHVIHHLFSRIPQYHAEEATRAIQPLLGNAYHVDKQRGYLACIWESFTRCQYVAPVTKEDEKNHVYWYQAGRIPPPEYIMGNKGWLPKSFRLPTLRFGSSLQVSKDE